MKVQVYDFNTCFNFGKHKGKTLLEVLHAGETRYIGWCIFYPVKCFVLDPNTIRALDSEHFFDDLDCSFPTEGGALPITGLKVGNTIFNKAWIMNELSTRYKEFKSDPEAYSKKAELHYRKFIQDRSR